jgi:serine/threonine-protein kinase
LLALIPSPPEREKFLIACRDIFPGNPAESLPPTTEVPKPEPAAHSWAPAVLEQAREDLAAHIGPMARMLVERAAARTRTRMELYQLLAADISSAKAREEFLKRAGS